MALEKKTVLDQIEIVLRDSESPVIQVREAVVIVDDGVEVSRRYIRRAIGWEDINDDGDPSEGVGSDRLEVRALTRMFVKAARSRALERRRNQPGVEPQAPTVP